MKISKGKIETAQKVVVYGVQGIGKSTFASHFPNPLFSDTEGSTKRLDVNRFDGTVQNWADLIEQAKYVRAHQPCATYVIDSIDWAERLAIKHICDTSGKKSIEDFGYGKGYTIILERMTELLNILEDIAYNGVNVVLTAHAQIRKIERPDDENAYDRYEMKLTKKVTPVVMEWADMVLFANYQTYTQKNENGKVTAKGKERMMYTSYNPVWDAKNRDGLPDELPFDFKEIAHLIPTFSEREKSNKAKTNNVKKMDAMMEVDEGDAVEIKSKQEVILDHLKAENISESRLVAFLQQKGLIQEGKTGVDNLNDEDASNILVRIDKIISLIKEEDDLPF